MTQLPKGPIAAEIEGRLHAAFTPTRLVVHDDSASHAGHAGHDSRGESHFTVEIVADSFAGLGRVERQRRVNAALADLLKTRIHALALRVAAPGEETR
jgi:BolA protein